MRLALGGLTLAALALRLWGIGDESLWTDEGWSVWVTDGSPADVVTRLRHEDFHPPLYMLVLWAWRHFFPSLEGMRALSAVLMAASVPFFFLFAHRLAGTTAGITAALLAAASPELVWFGQEMRSYGLVIFLASISCAMWVRLLDPAPRRVWIAYVLSTALIPWTHYLATLLIVAQNVAMIPRRDRWKPWLISQVSIAALFLPWLPTAWKHFTTLMVDLWVPAPTPMSLVRSLMELTHYTHDWTWMTWHVRWTMLGVWVIALALGVWALRANRRAAWVLGALILVPPAVELLVGLRQPVYYTRTFMYVTLGLYGLAGVAVAAIRLRTLQVAAVAALLITCAVGVIYQRGWSEKEDWRGAAQIITRLRLPDDAVIVYPDYCGHSLAPYTGERHSRVTEGVWSSSNRSEAREFDDLLKSPRVWVVLRLGAWDKQGRLEAGLARSNLTRRSTFDLRDVTVYLYERRD